MKDTLLVGTRKGLFTFRHEDGGWGLAHIAHLGDPVAYAFRDGRTGALWASLDHGHWGTKLHRSDDGGETWSDDLAPAYPESAEVEPGKPAKLELVWVVAPGGEDQPQRLYLGTNPGGLFVSDDGGHTFQLVRGLWDHPSRTPQQWFGGGRVTPGIHSIWVDPRDSDRVLVAVSCAGVFETLDGGETWNPRNKGMSAPFLPDPEVEVGQDPHFITACAAHPDVLWQQNHIAVYRSTDGAASWQEVSEAEGPVRFGFPIVAHPTNPEVAWVVPGISDQKRVAFDGRLQVSRTDDGGKTWRSQTDGLPADAWDVVYRHAFDGAGDGETLAFGSTTGNLYLTEDGGEAWRPLSHHLPPVYSVRFA